MKTKKLGNKHVCYQCGCKFYDLDRPQPLCPKCGVDQSDAQKRASVPGSRQASAQASALGSVSSARTRHRKRKEEPWEDEDDAFDLDDEDKSDSLEDGLTLVEEDDLSEGGDV